MKKKNMALLILAIFSMTTSGHAPASDMDGNFSINETIANPVGTEDVIEISETANVINITENSNETTVIESIIKEDQKKSSPGFGLTDTVTSLISLVILTTVIINIRKNR